MDLSPEVITLGTSLASAAARNTATAIADKTRALKGAKKNDETIAGLEEIISDLINDKAEITRIAQAYQSELVGQRLAEGDVQYITDTVLPVFKQFIDTSDENGPETKKKLDAIEALISAETVNVLQLLGFNFRRAIGEPLTERVEKLILSNTPASEDPQLIREKTQQLYIQLALDPEAFERYRALLS